MDQAQLTQHFESGKKSADRPSLIILSAVVSLVAFVAVISRWHAFHWWARLDAIFFVLILVTSALSEIFAGKRGSEHFGRFRLSLVEYSLIMLAIILFTSD
jgi:hypothetical protein